MCRWIDQAGCPDGKKQVTRLCKSVGAKQFPLRQVFSKPDNAGTNITTASAANWRTQAATALGWYTRCERMCLSAGEAVWVVQAAMQVQHILTTSAFVQVIDVLCHNGELGNMLCQSGNSPVCRVGLRPKNFHAPPFIPSPDKFFISTKCRRSGKVFCIEPLPQAGERISKSWDAAFGRYPCTGKDDDVLCLPDRNDQILWRGKTPTRKNSSH